MGPAKIKKIEPLLITLTNIFARLSQLIFFLMVGNIYGATGSTDLIISILTPLLVIAAAMNGTAESVVMPVFHRAENKNTAKFLQKYFIKRFIIFVIGLSLVIITATSFILEQFDLILLAIIFPIPLFSSLASLKTGLLNASGRFRTATMGFLFGGLAAIPFLIFSSPNIYNLAVSFLLFEIGKTAGLWLFADISKGGKSVSSQKTYEIIKWGTKNAKYQIINSFIMSLTLPIDIWFASSLNSNGSVTFIEYASKLWNIVPLIFVGHMAITYSNLSKTVNKHNQYLTNVHHVAMRYGLTGCLISLLVIIFSKYFVMLLYGMGQLNIDQQLTLSRLLNYYLLGAGPFIWGMVYVRALSAVGRIDLLFKVVCLSFAVNIIGNAVLVSLIGINGIGLSTSIMSLISLLFLAFVFEKNKRHYSFNLG